MWLIVSNGLFCYAVEKTYKRCKNGKRLYICICVCMYVYIYTLYIIMLGSWWQRQAICHERWLHVAKQRLKWIPIINTLVPRKNLFHSFQLLHHLAPDAIIMYIALIYYKHMCFKVTMHWTLHFLFILCVLCSKKL